MSSSIREGIDPEHDPLIQVEAHGDTVAVGTANYYCQSYSRAIHLRRVSNPALVQVLPEPKGPNWTRRRWRGRGAAGAEFDRGRVSASAGARVPPLDVGHDGQHGQDGYQGQGVTGQRIERH